MQKPKLIIFGDPKRKYAAQAVEEFTRFAENKAEILKNCFMETCSIDTLKKADFAVVFGGDGTILAAARQLSQASVPVIGVNVGKLGFLAEFSLEELKQLFNRIIKEDSLIENRMILRCCVHNNDKETFVSTAVNDLVITAGAEFNMIEMEISVQNQNLTACIGDGIIVSTPTGSTAYSLSAGGPILSANLAAMVITPICPHSLSFRPIVINAQSVVEIRPVRINKETTMTLDGRIAGKLKTDDIVTVQKDLGSFLVVNNPMRTQWDTLAGKLNWAEKPKYDKNIEKTNR